MNNKLIIMRGLPGSGKSTLAKSIFENWYENENTRETTCHVLSTDNFFTDEKFNYKFNPRELSIAHRHTFALFCHRIGEAVEYDMPALIILDNTNTQWWEFELYVKVAQKLGFEVEQKIPDTPWAFDIEELMVRQTHGVPRSTLEKMMASFEPREYIEDKIKGNY